MKDKRGSGEEEEDGEEGEEDEEDGEYSDDTYTHKHALLPSQNTHTHTTVWVKLHPVLLSPH